MAETVIKSYFQRALENWSDVVYFALGLRFGEQFSIFGKIDPQKSTNDPIILFINMHFMGLKLLYKKNICNEF